MKTSKIIIGICAVVLAFTSCTETNKSEQQTVKEVASQDYKLIGKTAVLTYPELKVEVVYIDENTLHWSQVDEKGNKTEGTEKVSYKKLNGHLFFLNWIEADGFTVSQVIDLKESKVIAYLSFSDAKSERGGRTSDFTEGTFEFIK